LLENRNIRFGIFPEGEKVLVGGFGLDRISRHRECPAQLQVRECPDGIADNDAAVIENFLELGRGFRAVARCQ
jgi:hypothetical protein